MSRGTPVQKIRMAKALWDAFGRAAKKNKTNRAVLIRGWATEYVEVFGDEEDASPK